MSYSRYHSHVSKTKALLDTIPKDSAKEWGLVDLAKLSGVKRGRVRSILNDMWEYRQFYNDFDITQNGDRSLTVRRKRVK
jgi:hypothetical protein